MNWIDSFKNNLLEVLYRDQPRDELGRFASTGGGGAAPAADRILSHMEPLFHEYSRVALDRMPPSRQESVAKAFDDVLGKHGVQIEEFDVRVLENDNVLGTYHHTFSRLTLNETYAPEGAMEALQAEAAFSWEMNTRMRMEDVESLLEEYGSAIDAGPNADGRYSFRGETVSADFIHGQRDAYVQEQKEGYAERPSTIAASEDPWGALAAHEAFHAVHDVKELGDAWFHSRDRHGVRNRDIMKVSDYATTNASEAFAEVGVAIREGMSIPDNVRAAFEETMATLGN